MLRRSAQHDSRNRSVWNLTIFAPPDARPYRLPRRVTSGPAACRVRSRNALYGGPPPVPWPQSPHKYQMSPLLRPLNLANNNRSTSKSTAPQTPPFYRAPHRQQQLFPFPLGVLEAIFRARARFWEKFGKSSIFLLTTTMGHSTFVRSSKY